MPAGEGQEPLQEGLGALGRLQCARQDTLFPGVPRPAALEHVQPAEYRREQVVEVVRHAARELAHGVHLLGLPKRLLSALQGLGLCLLLADVTSEGVDHVVFWRGHPRNPAVGAVLAAQTVLKTRDPRLHRTIMRFLRVCEILRMDEGAEVPAPEVGLVEIENGFPSWIGGLEDALGVDHGHQVAGIAPRAIAFTGPVLDLDGQILVGRPQARRSLPTCSGKIETGAHPGDQLPRRKRLGQVVVGAGVKAIDPRLLAGARGQEDDRQILQVRIGPQGRKQLESVELGHHDIRQH